MTDLKVKLAALSEASSSGEWESLGSVAGCVYLTDKLTQQGSSGNSPFACTLVNAYRSGDLIVKGEETFTKYQLEQAVREALEEAAGVCDERADVLDDMGIEMGCCVGTARNCRDDVSSLTRARTGEGS